LATASNKALENRNAFNTGDATAGHGWMHKALVSARLKNGDSVISSLLPMMVNNGYYTSLMTDHDTNRRCSCYCTDTLFGTVASVNEALLYSNTGIVEVLPALPSDWTAGLIRGLMARTQVEVKELSWDLDMGVVMVTLSSIAKQQQTLQVRLALPWTKAEVEGKEGETIYYERASHVSLSLNHGIDVTVKFIL
jgi:hypothetical protein